MPETVSAVPASRPIIFGGPMVRAILDGRKTQTRRVIRPQPAHGCHYSINGAGTHALHLGEIDGETVYVPPRAISKDHRLPCPYGVPGDLLWVRETFCDLGIYAEIGKLKMDRFHYAADGKKAGWAYKPSIHMPRHASRITLRVTGVRVGRVQAIKEADAVAEGVTWNSGPTRAGHTHPISAYRSLWDEINARRGFGWDVNPWVWVIEFEREEPSRVD